MEGPGYLAGRDGSLLETSPAVVSAVGTPMCDGSSAQQSPHQVGIPVKFSSAKGNQF